MLHFSQTLQQIQTRTVNILYKDTGMSIIVKMTFVCLTMTFYHAVYYAFHAYYDNLVYMHF